jgi:putative ABC transport system substrate-binding protein
MRRRDFNLVLAGIALAPLRAVHAQRPGPPVVGFLSSVSPEGFAYLVEAFRQGLKEMGFVEAASVAIEYRWAEGRLEKLPELARELVNLPVAVIAAGGGSEARRAAKAATTTIPVVFVMGGDPIKEGLVGSLNRPGGNVTGVSFLTNFLEAKRLGLLAEVVSAPAPIAVLVDPTIFATEAATRDVQSAARTTGRRIHLLKAVSEHEIETALANAASAKAGGILVAASPLFNSRRQLVVDLIARQGIPAVYESIEFVEAGGLMSYGTSTSNAYRQMGVYVGRILHGARPADLPVMQSTKYELAINLKTAKALNIKIPQSILLRADEVIQ